MTGYSTTAPDRTDVDAWPGPVVLEFGTDWCGFCQAATPFVKAGLADFPGKHVRVEDGPGRPLGRSFRVKLWPTLIVLKDGVEVARVVRPQDADEVKRAVATVA